MENIFIEYLPPWVETGLQPAFYDKESGTVLQQTARMYAKVNELTKAFNDFSEETKDTVNEYIAKFVELYNYVHDYFDNLDVQEEINNKLDDMMEAGTLQEIITTYIQSNVAWTFDTVADMKQATNLVSGSFAQTLGFRSVNDGGGAIYKITNTGTANEMDVIAVGDLLANLVIKDSVTPEMFGAYGDGNEDDTDYFDRALEYIKDKNTPLILNNEYKITSEITTTNADNITIIGHNAKLKVLTTVAFYFNTVNKLSIKGLTVVGQLEDGSPVGALAHALYANYVDIEDIIGDTLGYVYKNDYHLTNDASTQFITKEIKFENINCTDCEVLLLTGFVENLVVENIFNETPNNKTRELFYLYGGIVNGYFKNITADYTSRWPFHFNVTGGSTPWDLTLDVNKNHNLYIDNIVVGQATCILHFTSYCKKIYVNNLMSNCPIYESTNGHTCEEVYVTNSVTNMPSGNSAGTVNKIEFNNCNINDRATLAKATDVVINGCYWVSDATTNVFFVSLTAGSLTVKNSKLYNNSATSQQVFQTNNGVKISLINNEVYLNAANRFVTMVDDTDKAIIYGNIIEATSINALNNKTPYIKFGNYINGSSI